jgi:chromosome segregation ATPase
LTALKIEVASVEKEVADLERGLAVNAAEHATLEGKKKTLEQSIAKSKEGLASQQELTREEVKHREELEGKLIVYRDESQKMRRMIDTLEKRREQCAREAAEAQVRYVKAQEEAKMSEIQLSHTQRLIAAADEDLQQKQTTYEQLRVERNTYNRQLIAAQDANVDFKKRVKTMTQQAQELKAEIRVKETTFAAERFELKKAQGRREKLEREMKRLKEQWDVAEKTMQDHQKELDGLETRIRETDGERERLLAEQLSMMKDRDVLGTQLVRKNDEIALLQEKIKILQETMRKGEIEYNQRQEDAAELRRLIADTRRRNLILQRQCDQTSEFEGKVQVLQKDLMQEQTRVRALSEELEDPNNPHRWRHLYGEDPPPAELLNRIRQLQRRLIKKTEDIINTKKEIADLKEEVGSAQGQVDDQPTPEMMH